MAKSVVYIVRHGVLREIFYCSCRYTRRGGTGHISQEGVVRARIPILPNFFIVAKSSR
jgi:hypothetical protein